MITYTLQVQYQPGVLFVVVVVQRVVVVISVISKQTLNKASLQLYPNLYSVYKKMSRAGDNFFWTSNREKQKKITIF